MPRKPESKLPAPGPELTRANNPDVAPLPPAPAPQPAVEVPTTRAQAPGGVTDEMIRKLASLSPEDKALIRARAGLVGVSPGIRQHDDGSVDVTIRVNPDCVPQLRTWAEEAGKTFEEQTQELVDLLLSGYLNGAYSEPMVATVDGKPLSGAQAGGAGGAGGGS